MGRLIEKIKQVFYIKSDSYTKNFKRVENGDEWGFIPKTKYDLNELYSLNYVCWLSKDRSNIEIFLESDNDREQPTDIQNQTLVFILNNQAKIIDSIYEYYYSILLPAYSEAMDIEDNEIAVSKDQLSRVFGIRKIEILQTSYANSNYFLIEFHYRYDCEHGLYLMFNRDKIIDFFSMGEKNFDAIDIENKGLYNRDGSPIDLTISKFDNSCVHQSEYLFTDRLKPDLPEGSYRFEIICNQTSYRKYVTYKNEYREKNLNEIVTKLN